MGLKALVVSGGGSRGAWAVGVLRALITHHHEQFDIVVGTSTGALIAPLAALGAEKDITELRDVYTKVGHNDILRNRLPFIRAVAPNAIAAFLTGRDSVFGTGPLRALVDRHLTEDIWDRLRESGRQAWVTAVNLQTGKVRYFGSSEEGMSIERFASAMVASASIPVFMTRARILKENGFRFVDGGVRDLIPIRKAIELGASEIKAIMLDAEQKPVFEVFSRIPRVLLRFIALCADETGRNDLEQCELITEELDWRGRLNDRLSKLMDPVKLQEAFDANSDEHEPLQKDGRRFVPCTLSVIRPQSDLGDVLQFKPEVMRIWEQQGYEYACEKANWTTRMR